MPELPEIETIRLYLHKHLIGKTINGTEIREHKMFHGDPNDIFDTTIIDTQRKGKILTLKLEKNNDILYLSFHLKLSGQILYAQHKEKAQFSHKIPLANSDRMPAKTTRVIFFFTDNSALFFNDLRKFGWAKVSDKPKQPQGEDVLSERFTSAYLDKALSHTKRPVKTVLLDQEIIAGIGNIYANDALWESLIYPARPSNTLSKQEKTVLYQAIKKVVGEGITYKGSSAKDELYVLPDGTAGGYQHHFRVYHRQGQECKRCKTLIETMKIGGRGTFYCPHCQT
ncbi:bifunctional DNA-formamidopyrimidine glycosylase/DNA-(apurinic or apyrimidinic site) lyase [Candidatus Roizmanbacteria bacterium]|nr:MAG: bifunctional DNA-formamidopyrimidine glycosylase/DNA-(apurinic or apyrimidinic site) lyase [Candidatus Roizmanbacteria bacterium]